MKIGYFADGPWSHKAFEKIIADSGFKIEFICVRFDTKDDTLKKYCSDYEIDYLMDKRADVSNTFIFDRERMGIVKPRTLGFRYKKSF